MPLEAKDIEVVNPAVEWQQIAWGNETVKVRETVIGGLRSFKYYKRSGK